LGFYACNYDSLLNFNLATTPKYFGPGFSTTSPLHTAKNNKKTLDKEK